MGVSNLIDYCDFLDCEASTSGGAISFTSENSVLNHSTFNNCNSVVAGAIYVSGDSSFIDYSEFIKSLYSLISFCCKWSYKLGW